MKENNKPEKHEYKVKFEFENGESYTLNYSYDSEAQKIKYNDVKAGPKMKLKKHLSKKVLDLESALVCAMQQNKVENLTAENIKASEDQIKNNLINLDLGEEFLIDIIPDIFGLQNSCENNLQVGVPYIPYIGMNNEITKEKTEQIINQVDKIYDKSGKKKITFVEKKVKEYHLDDDMNSWIQGCVCGHGGDGYGQDDKYKTAYANFEIETIEQENNRAEASANQKTNEAKESNYIQLDYIQTEENENLDPEKLKTSGQISLGGEIIRIIFLVILIALVIFLPIYLGIIGLLFSNVAIPIVVFSSEAILITLIIILILSIRDIYCQNGPFQKQLSSESNGQKNRQENSIDLTKSKVLKEKRAHEKIINTAKTEK